MAPKARRKSQRETTYPVAPVTPGPAHQRTARCARTLIADDNSARMAARRKSRSQRSLAAQVNAAGIVVADRTVPAVTVARNPCVSFHGEPVNTGDEQDPGEQVPAWEKRTDTRPSIRTGIDA